MKFREIIQEEGDSAGTVAADITGVTYPLFVRGRTRRERRKNARAAVGQSMDSGRHTNIIGRGVYENIDETSIATMRDYYAGQGDGYDATKLSVMRNWFAQNDQPPNEEIKRIAQKIKNKQKLLPGEWVRYTEWINRKDALKKMHKEAHVVDHSDVIYRLDTANPMDDTEVLVLGGAGRYSLKGLRDKARREAAQLAKELESEHGDAFRRNSENIRQLTNTLNTIVAAYNQLERIRRRGGARSRGIRREHYELVKEGIAIINKLIERQRFNDMELAIMEGGGSVNEYYESLAMQEKAPPGFDKKLYKELIDRYGQTSRAYATMWTIHNKTKGKSK